MRETKVYVKNFIGTSYQVGAKIGTWVLSHPDLLRRSMLPPGAYPHDKFVEISDLLDRCAEGVNDEIRGFADTLGISVEQVLFYASTYLERGCSLMAARPEKTTDGHTLMARNYDFSDEMEEMCFAYTEIKGKYRHIGSTLNLFGRCDGMNEHGLAACMACNGLPVGNFEGGQKAGVTGFSFWVLIRSVLENCKNVREAIEWSMAAPIGFNINLMLADSQNNIALLQCIDGHKVFQILDSPDSETVLKATNHAVMDEMKPYEKIVLDNSVVRLNRITEFFEKHKNISKDDIKALLFAPYPEGLCCHFYREFFGTLRSMIFDTADKTIEMTFGSPQANKWHTFAIDKLEEGEIKVLLPEKKAEQDFFQIYRK